jgi:VIT1/CCC1 family predicted Fe2+/Mn2+ transporter
MENQLHAGPEPSMSSLVTGIISDAQDLIKQQLDLVKHEIREDVRKAKEAAASLALGLGIATIGGILFCMVPVYLLNELAHWPLWASFLLVGGLMLVVGAVLTYLAKKEIDTINPLQEESAQALKENVEWITKPK